MKTLLLRTALALAALSLVVTLSGCGDLTSTTVNLPVSLSAMRVRAGVSQPGFARQYVDERASGWQGYNDVRLTIDSARLRGTVRNRTGNAANPSAAMMHVYVSDTEYATLDALADHGVLLLDVSAPVGQAETSFDSDFTAVSYDARAIMQDGVFWVYAVGASVNDDVELTGSANLTLKARIGMAGG